MNAETGDLKVRKKACTGMPFTFIILPGQLHKKKKALALKGQNRITQGEALCQQKIQPKP